MLRSYVPFWRAQPRRKVRAKSKKDPKSKKQTTKRRMPQRNAATQKHRTKKAVSASETSRKKKAGKPVKRASVSGVEVGFRHRVVGKASSLPSPSKLSAAVSDEERHGVFEKDQSIEARLQSAPILLPQKEEKHSEKLQTNSDGLDIAFIDETATASESEKEVRQQLREEGFLELDEEKDVVSAKGGIMGFLHMTPQEALGTVGQKLSRKQQKNIVAEQHKKEVQEEKEWKREAKKREKQEEERRTEKVKQAKESGGNSEHMHLRVPKTKKESAVTAFLAALATMGLGRQRTAFIDNLGTMMDAGLPLLDALRALKEEERKRPMRKLIGRIIVAVETGSPLWRAMEGQHFFKQQQIAMVRVGEEAGNLVENMQYLAEQEEKDHALRSKVKTAMIYPIIILVMLTVVVFGLGLFILPNLIQVIQSLDVPLPLFTRAIILFTGFFTTHARTIVPSFFGGVIVFALLAKFTPLKIVVQWLILHTPGIGTLIREATISRFGVVMGGLLQAGVPVTEALESLVNVSGIHRYRAFYTELLEHIQLGDSFTTSFHKIRKTGKCLPSSVQQLVITGEQSGSLTKVMLKIAQIHEKRAAEVAEKLPVILEPLLLLFVGGLVAGIALGVLAPIYSVVGSIG